MTNVTFMDINGSNNVEASVGMKMLKASHNVLIIVQKYFKFQYGFDYTYMYIVHWQKTKSAF